MEWLERMGGALNYIEENLDGEIEIGQAAKRAVCSAYHFTRMFGYITGVPLAEYIRRRRLTLAGLDLTAGAKVMDVALRYGYDSPTAFNRAFRALHGISPSAAKQPGAKLVAYPRISFQISIKGEAEMNYRIEKKDAFTIVGYKMQTTSEDGANLRDIPAMWNGMDRQKMQAVCALMDGGQDAVLGVCANMQGQVFDYYIGVQTTKAAPESMQALRVEAANWAVFEAVGPMPDAIQATWKRIYTEWMPTSGYKATGGPELEAYPEGDTSAADYRCEVWIPVEKE